MRKPTLAFFASAFVLFAASSSMAAGTRPPAAKAATVPTATVSSPANGASLVAGQSTAVQGTTTHHTGIARVTFFNGPTQLGTDTSSPYWVTWTPSTGSHDLWMASESLEGGIAQSNAVRVSAGTVTNPPPTVTLTAPAAGQTVALNQPLTLSATASDSNGSVAAVRFFVGAASISAPVTPPYSASWTPTVAGVYNVRVVATDNGGSSAVSPPVTITVTPNLPPSVALTSPSNGATFYVGDQIGIAASASDADGSIATVEFWQDGTLLGRDTSAPYTQTFSAGIGTYGLTAVAYDQLGASTTSAPVSVAIIADANPTASLTSPAHNSGLAFGQSVTLSATATDNIGVQKVDFYSGAELIGSDSSAPYSIAWTPPAATTYLLRAIATDVRGGTGSSANVTLHVSAPPTVSLTTPAAGAVFVHGQTVSLTAAATTPRAGGVQKVEFFDGETLINTDTAAPFSYQWPSPALGTHTLKARAYDDIGLATTSSTRAITVSAAPTIVMSASGLNHTIGQTVTLSTSVGDSDGSVVRVEFYDGATLLATDNAAPFTYAWATSGAIGARTLTARVYDNVGLSTTSSPVTITLHAQPTVTLTQPSAAVTIPNGYAIALAATATADGAVQKVEFFDNGALIGTVSSAPYSRTWSSTTSGLHAITAKATDERGYVTAATPAVTVTVNTPPTVSVTAPAHNASHATGLPLTLSATAADSDGTITKVEFFQGATSLGSDASPPYSVVWTPASGGMYGITAKATDNGGLVTQSTLAITVHVGGAPSVTMTAPSAGAVVHAGTAITVSADASAVAPSTVSHVEFYDGSTLLLRDTVAPYTHTWNNAAAGPHTLSAKVTDSLGLTKSSTAAITVNAKPTVTLSASPAAVTIGQTIVFTASAADMDGSVSKVEFLDAGSVVATDNAAPFTYSWPSQGLPGVRTWTARAYDDRNAITTSAGADVNLSAAPTVTLSAPATPTTIPSGVPYLLSASVGEMTASIAKVEFYAGSMLLGSDTSEPYTYGWTTPPYGVHLITAKATDVRGYVVTSSGVALTVNSPPTASLTSPQGGNFLVGESVTITATAGDVDGTVQRVDFYDGTDKIGTDSSAPYSYAFTVASTGTKTLSVVAVDNADAGSPVVPNGSATAQVTFHHAPDIELTEPGAGDVFSIGAARELAAAASDDNAVAKIEFLVDGIVQVERVAPPSTKTWSATGQWTGTPQPGEYAVSARVTDTFGRTKTTAPVTVRLVGTPPLELTAPNDGLVVETNEAVDLAATADDPRGDIAKVEFLSDGAVLSEDAAAPYAYRWNAPTLGHHSLQVRATTRSGQQYHSSARQLHVSPPRIVMESPLPAVRYVGGQRIALRADVVEDVVYPVKRIEYYINGQKIDPTATEPPYEISWTAPEPGASDAYTDYVITAHAYTANDQDPGSRSTAKEVPFRVYRRPSAVLELGSDPRPQGRFNQYSPLEVKIKISPEDAIQTIERTEFSDGYRSSSQVGNDVIRYWVPLDGVKDYTLRGIAHDLNGEAYATPDVKIMASEINPGPTVTIDKPTYRQAYSSKATIRFEGKVIDPEGIDSIDIRVKMGEEWVLIKQIKYLQNPGPGLETFEYEWHDNDPFRLQLPYAKVHYFSFQGRDRLGALGHPKRGTFVLAQYSDPESDEPELTKGELIPPRSVALHGKGFDAQSYVEVNHAGGDEKLGEYRPGPSFQLIADANGTSLQFVLDQAHIDEINNGDGLDMYVVNPTFENLRLGPVRIGLMPAVTLVEPFQDGVRGEGPINLIADAFDPRNDVASVKFLDNNTVIFTDTEAPYEYTLEKPALGEHVFTAKVINRQGVEAHAPEIVTITVDKDANKHPTVRMLTPRDGVSIGQQDMISVAAEAADADNGVDRVEFFARLLPYGRRLSIGTAQGEPPYFIGWAPSDPGDYELSAVAIDPEARATRSRSIRVRSTAKDGGGSSGIDPVEEHSRRIGAARNVAPIGSDLFGEQVSLYDGSTEFAVTDIDLPGNGGLPVRLGRRLSVEDRRGLGYLSHFGDWELDVPSISGTFSASRGWTVGGSSPHARCSAKSAPDMSSIAFRDHEIWHGVHLHLPGGGDSELLLNTNPNVRARTTAPWITSGLVKIGCTPFGVDVKDGRGEGFIATTPDGVKYTFDKMVERSTTALKRSIKVDDGGILTPPWGDDIGGYNQSMWDAVRRLEVSGTERYDTHTLPRKRIYLLATRVEDRFGNWVEYDYVGDRLGTITASDGRRITLEYDNDGRIWRATASDDGASSEPARVWTYGYASAAAFSKKGVLTKVTLPHDVSTPESSIPKWTYRYAGTMNAAPIDMYGSGVGGEPCSPPGESSGDYTLTATHPSGATGTFAFGMTRHKRSVAILRSQNCMGDEGNRYLQVPDYFDGWTLFEKSITGAGLPPMTWTYAYESASTGYPCDPCDESKVVTITQPDGVKTEHDFGVLYGENEGRLLSTRVRATTGAVLSETRNTYLAEDEVEDQHFRVSPLEGNAPTAQEATRWGESLVYGFDPVSVRIRPIVATTTTQDGVSFSAEHVADDDVYPFDTLARPLKTTRVSRDDVDGDGDEDVLHSRTHEVEYHDDTNGWVLGQTAALTEVLSPTQRIEIERTTFNANALPATTTSYGRLDKTFAWYPGNGANAGLLKSITDGRNNVTTLSDYRRGIPQKITLPNDPDDVQNPQLAGVEQLKATVSAFGDITSVTDASGAKTEYAYDPLGRIVRIDHPDTSRSWLSTTIGYEWIEATEYDLAGGHWRRVETTGTPSAGMRISTTDYDALSRPSVQRDDVDRPDAQRPTGFSREQTFVQRTYDRAGREQFVSHPKGTFDSIDDEGTYTLYDALGRVTSTTVHAEAGNALLTTLVDYLDGFQVRTTNPRGDATTTSFMAWDQPSYDFPIKVLEPEGVTTTIARDVFGKPLELKRSGITNGTALSAVRSYVYDSRQRLCKTVEPETGATMIGYDAANNVAWRAVGMTQTGLAACDDGTLAPGQKTTFTYDAMNRVDLITHPAGTAGIDYAYDKNGAVVSAKSGGSEWTYEYNKLGLPEKETLHTTGKTFVLDWSYDSRGSLASLLYPDGFLMEFAPDTQGRQTRSGPFATSIGYHPGGALAGFRFGNGIERDILLNKRLLPKSIRDLAANGAVYLDRAFTYDENGNVKAIVDAIGQESRTLEYDARNRLINATGTRGPEAYTYDVLDNILTATGQGARNRTYAYDYTRNRLKQIGTTNGGTYTYGYVTQPDAPLASIVDRGQVTSRTDPDGNTMTFAFDAASRITGITHSASAANDETYAYDAHGLRVLTTRSDGKKRWQVYGRNGQLLYVEDEKEGARIDYVHVGNTVVAERSTPLNGGDATITYLHADQLGTPSLQTNASAAELLDKRLELTPWGERYDNAPYTDGRGYTGHAMDAASGLTYMQQRYYDPVAGRFLSADPVGVSPQDGLNFNRYWYASNTPFTNTDPDGRCDGPTTCAIDRDIAAMNSGEISLDEFEDASAARATGAVAGIALVGAALVAPEVAVASAGFGRSMLRWAAGVTRAQRGAAQKIDNVLKNNAKPHDFRGVVNELKGVRTGYDHVTEMRNSVAALTKALRSIEGSLKNPNMPMFQRWVMKGAHKRGSKTLKKMKEALGEKK